MIEVHGDMCDCEMCLDALEGLIEDDTDDESIYDHMQDGANEQQYMKRQIRKYGRRKAYQRQHRGCDSYPNCKPNDRHNCFNWWSDDEIELWKKDNESK